MTHLKRHHDIRPKVSLISCKDEHKDTIEEHEERAENDRDRQRLTSWGWNREWKRKDSMCCERFRYVCIYSNKHSLFWMTAFSLVHLEQTCFFFKCLYIIYIYSIYNHIVLHILLPNVLLMQACHLILECTARCWETFLISSHGSKTYTKALSALTLYLFTCLVW